MSEEDELAVSNGTTGVSFSGTTVVTPGCSGPVDPPEEAVESAGVGLI